MSEISEIRLLASVVGVGVTLKLSFNAKVKVFG